VEAAAVALDVSGFGAMVDERRLCSVAFFKTVFALDRSF
jgi:hypothetical protein